LAVRDTRRTTLEGRQVYVAVIASAAIVCFVTAALWLAAGLLGVPLP
jgi:hypothetical protein